jgi:HK97 family phage portal protein
MEIKNFFKKIFNLGLSDEKAWDKSLWRPFGGFVSGEIVNEQTALNYSPVYNAVSLIAGTVATLPLKLIRREERKTIPETSNPLYRILHDQPNPYMTALTFRECMMSHVLLWGNAYAEIVRNRIGQIKELWIITPNRVRPKLTAEGLFYEISMDTEAPIVLPQEKILHVKGLGFDGFVGYSVVAMARKSLGLGMAMETFGGEFFSNGTHPGLVISHPSKLDPQTYANMRTALQDSYSGLGKAHRLMLLDEGLKLEKISMPNSDAQFLESRQFQIPEVARWFNLPPHKLKDLTKSSFSNIESEQISFVTDSILPWLVRLEQSYNSALLTESEKKRGLYTKHNVEGLLRGNAKDRGEYYRTLWNVGAISINEIREKEDLDPIENGDEYFIPLNMMPLSKIDELDFSKKENPQETEADEEMVRDNEQS